jgi:hypothetical protein
MLRKHLAGDLGIARLVCTDEAKLIPADEGYETVEKKESGHHAEDEEFLRRLGGEASPDATEPGDGCTFFPCAGCGGLLKVTHCVR